MKRGVCRLGAVLMAGFMAAAAGACGQEKFLEGNLAEEQENSIRSVLLFAPMEKSDPDNENVSRTAFDLTVGMAEEQLGVTVEYRTYTAENYQEKTYDEVALDRARNNMDDFYLLNPDTIQALGEEGKLADLSGLDCAKNLRDVVKTANTVDGKLVAIPQEVVVNGLFVNQDMFDKYHLELPNTPEEFLECCRVFKENGIETPVGPTAGGWKTLFWLRRTQICITGIRQKRKLQH